MKKTVAVLMSLLVLAGCGENHQAAEPGWTDTDVSFDSDGLTIHGTYRHDGRTGRRVADLRERSHRPQR